VFYTKKPVQDGFTGATGLAFRSQTSCLLTTGRLSPLSAASMPPIPSAGASVQAPLVSLITDF